MKKIIIFSEESIFSGIIKCGIAEVVDSLANCLTDAYEVSIICKDGGAAVGRKAADIIDFAPNVKYAKFLKVNYYMIAPIAWPYEGYKLLNQIKPEIFHNFFEPGAISALNYKPLKTIFTFDSESILLEYQRILKRYDAVTSFSKGYVDYLKTKPNVAAALLKLGIKTPSFGILSGFFDPERGISIPQSYSKSAQQGKEVCKRRLCEKLGLEQNKPIFLVMCRMVKEKGIDHILDSISFFNENEASLVVIGVGEKEYEKRMVELAKQGKFIYIPRNFSTAQIPSIISGADFFLQPSTMESGGIMPLVASNYGTIPIITLNGGLGDNFNSNNAIVIKDYAVRAALQEAMRIYNDKNILFEKRKLSMSQDFSWDARKRELISIYEE